MPIGNRIYYLKEYENVCGGFLAQIFIFLVS